LEEFEGSERRQFSLRDIMVAAGLEYDDFSDRTAATNFLSRMREVMLDFSDWFWGQPQYQQFINDGLTDRAVFKLVVKAMASFGIFTLAYDREQRTYTLMTLPQYARILKLRSLSMRTEFVRRAEEVAIMGKKFPALRETFEPASLPTDGHFMALPGERPNRCGKCGMTFVSEETLDQHDQRRHRPDVEETDPL
jgi:hypothetical protein